MPNFKEIEHGEVGLIQQQNGRIIQIALTREQSKTLQMFLAVLSQEEKLIQMPEDYDLVLKSTVKTFKP